MRGLRRNHRNPDQSPPVQLKMPNLTNRNLKLPSEVGNHRANKTPLFFKRVHIPKKQINLQDASEHVLFRLISDRTRSNGGEPREASVREPARRANVFRRT